MELNDEVIKKINENYMTLDELALLYSLMLNLNWDLNITPASVNKLKRLKFLDENSVLTPEGEQFLFECLPIKPTQKPEGKEVDLFEEFWTTYPKDDAIKNFQASRLLRWNKGETRRLYKEALTTVSHSQLLQALKAEIAYRVKNSNVENKLKYMFGSVNWFKNKGYLEFLGEELVEDKEQQNYGKELV